MGNSASKKMPAAAEIRKIRLRFFVLTPFVALPPHITHSHSVFVGIFSLPERCKFIIMK